MKKYIISIFFVMGLLNISFSQNASTYFPSSTGYKWYYRTTTLDSLNNPQPISTYRIDSFAVIVTYQGLLADKVLSKTNLANINQNAPYNDTSYFNFQGTNGWVYVQPLKGIDTSLLAGLGGIINFLRSFNGWYSVFRFAQTVNTNYTIVSRDTTITIDTLTLPLRLTLSGRRLNDQTISTINGNYLTKKFAITTSLYYLLTVPPFPTVQIPIIQRPDTSWIASSIWVVKDLIPSVNVDLSTFGVPISFYVPGQLTELTAPTGINNNSTEIISEYKLFQNYPNPFNPKTIINYQLSMFNYVSLKVYDVLGNEVATLVNEKQNVGSYEVEFDGANLSSGIYFYKLHAGDFIDKKRMILIK